MSPSASRRAVLAAALSAAGLFASLLVAAPPAAAHAVEGGELPAPPWLLGYVGAFVVVAAAVVLRASWAGARLGATDVTAAAPAPGRATDAPRLHVGHAIGSAGFALVVVAAVAGEDSAAANVAPVGVLVWWMALPIAALLLGDLMAGVNPFQLPAAALRRTLGATASPRADAPEWTAAALFAAFSWYFLAYHRPGSPRALAVFLLVYTAAALLGAVRWGRAWLATGEGFAGLSAAVALVSWRRTDRVPVPGLAALVTVWIGAAMFDGVSSTSFWTDVLGSSSGWSRTMLNTVGLIWMTAIVGGAYLLAVRVADRESDGGGPLLRPLGVALVPLGLGWFVAHEMTLLLIEAQNLIVLVSDPLGRGWDLFGTARGFDADYGVVEESWVRWVQLATLLIGHVAAVVLAHDLALRLRRRQAAPAVTWAVAVLAATSLVAAAYLVL